MARREVVSEHEKLTPEHAFKVLIDSYLLSQGDFKPFHEALLQVLFSRNPQWIVKQNSTKYVAIERRLKDGTVIQRLQIDLNKDKALGTRDHPHAFGAPYTLAQVSENWLNSVDIFLKLLCGDAEYRAKKVPTKKEIFGYFVERDFRFFTNIGGMVYHIRDESFVVDYLLEGAERKRLLTPEFKDLCKWLATVRFSRKEIEEWEFELGFIQEGIDKLSDPKKRINIRKALMEK